MQPLAGPNGHPILTTGQSRTLDIRVAGDFPEVRPGLRKLEEKQLASGRLSPTGQRAVFEVRGEILTIPVQPLAEWRQMYQETWRIERDFLYHPGLHGLEAESHSGERRTRKTVDPTLRMRLAYW